MRILVQRSKKSSVTINNKVVGKIDKGLVLFVGFMEGDTSREIDYMIKKVLNLRIFDDENMVPNLSVLDVGGSILSISQFTLYGDAKKGARPSYINAMGGEDATKMYDLFNKKLKEHIKVEEGIFGADMFVSLTNNGPFTIILEKEGE